jgi:glycosyltransferase involved in cell wall biosynthesis
VSIEIICVDDGSLDNTESVVSEVQRRHANVVYKKLAKNQGVSHARNVGIAIANGTWITYLDADDSIDMSALESVLKVIPAKCDIAICQHVFTDNGKHGHPYFLKEGPLDRQQIIALQHEYLSNPVGNSVIGHCWGKIYRNEFIRAEEIHFDESLSIYEDLLFVADCLKAARSGYYSDRVVYSHTPSQGLGTQFEHLPLGFSKGLQILATTIEPEMQSQDLYSAAYSAYFAKSLFLARRMPYRRLRRFLKKLSPCPVRIDSSSVSNQALRIAIWLRIYEFPLPYFVFSFLFLRKK